MIKSDNAAIRIFSAAYVGKPRWDIGAPQAAFIRLADEGALQGPVLDIGCGSGETALFLASRGYEVLGIDIAPNAIALARSKARQRDIDATFRVFDAMELGALGRTFATAIDSGAFHVFSDEQRVAYAHGAASIIEPGGMLHILSFSEHEPEWGDIPGPRRLTIEDFHAVFEHGWEVESVDAETILIDPERLKISIRADIGHSGRCPGWFVHIRRTTDR